jgi:hypothetical protein
VTGLTLDAGALIAFERDVRRVAVLLRRLWERGETIFIPAGVIGQVWRDGARQVNLSRLLSKRGVDIVTLDDFGARAAGQLCGLTRTADVIDASVVLCAAKRGTPVLTSDPDDLRRLDPSIGLIVV